jgi:hypothetical protein
MATIAEHIIGPYEERWDYEQIIQRTRAASETGGESGDQAAEIGDGRAESLLLYATRAVSAHPDRLVYVEDST